MEADKRFSRAVQDARFRVTKRKQKGPELDERFKTKFKDDKFRVRRRVDKYGRVIRKDGRAGYGRHTEVDMEVADAKRMFGMLRDASDDENEVLQRKGKGEQNAFNEDSSDEESSTAEDNEEEDFIEEIEDERLENGDTKRGEATKRFAVLGLDWDYREAVDLFACFKSFCPPGGAVRKVSIHPSEFGIAQMEKERKLGPLLQRRNDVEALRHAQQVYEKDSETKSARAEHIEYNTLGDIDEGKVSTDGVKVTHGAKSIRQENESEDEDDSGNESETGDDGDSVDFDADSDVPESQANLRDYEEQRTRYYYAVAEFSSLSTASKVYDELDGLEFSSSGRLFDLQFIPADFKIPYPARDVATSLPATYKPPKMDPSTLNNSKVRLMWDADDPDRLKLRKKTFTKEEIESMDLQAYLGSDSESDPEESEAKTARAARIRALLLGDSTTEPQDTDEGEDADEAEGMEVTFEPGLEEKGAEILKRREEKERSKNETIGETQNRKREEAKEKKLERWKEERKLAKRTAKLDETDVAENPFEGDPFFTAEADHIVKSRAAREEARLETSSGKEDKQKSQSQRNAELELVLMDDKPVDARRRAIYAESDEEEEEEERRRKKRRRGKRRRERLAEQTEKRFKPDLDDPRFKDIVEDREFAVDPTHPKFGKSELSKRLLTEKAKRSTERSEAKSEVHVSTQNGDRHQPNDTNQPTNGSLDMLRLAAKLKNRSKRKVKVRP